MPIELITSLIGAAATILVALLQMHLAWRKELQARAEHRPVSKKGSRGPVLAVFLLMIASAVGGFALSQYFSNKARENTAELEASLRDQLDQLSSSTQKLETMRLSGEGDLLRKFQAQDVLRRGIEGAVATVNVGKCKVVVGESETESVPCNPAHAMKLEVCAEVPLSAKVTTMDLFARVDDKSWRESRVQIGEDFGGGKFSDAFAEQPVSEMYKQVCQTLNYWRSESGFQARIVAHYMMQDDVAQSQTADDATTSAETVATAKMSP
jgi:hypothetical protein